MGQRPCPVTGNPKCREEWCTTNESCYLEHERIPGVRYQKTQAVIEEHLNRNSISAEKLRQRMASLKIDKDNLARRIGVGGSLVRCWMNGTYAVPFYVEYILDLIERNNFLEKTLRDYEFTRAELSGRRKSVRNPYLDTEAQETTHDRRQEDGDTES